MMVSTITQRIGGAVDGVPVNTGGGGIIQCTNVAGTDTVTADSEPTIRAYFGKQLFMIRPAAANTGAVTLNIEGLGALPWRTPSGAALAAAALSPDLDYLIKLSEDETEFRTVSPF